MRPSIFLNILLIAFISCREEKKTAVKVTPGNAEVKHAKRFALVYEGSDTRIYLFGNRNNNDTTARYLITSENRPGAADKFVVIKSPCTKIAALSSIYATMLVELGAIDKLVAIDNIDYVNNGQVREKFRTGQLKELARAPEVDVEQTIMLRPEVVLTFGMGDEVSGSLKKLSAAGIPVAVSIDHLEETPLARAEWIKFFGAFAGRKNEADSIFNLVEKKYNEILSRSGKVSSLPSVFSETKYGDVWYMPGGKSYMAHLLRDAGANYLWRDNNDFGSLPLSFEQVYSRAASADFWINLPLVTSKQQLIAQEKRYEAFKAFRENKIYNNDKVTNEKGYSIYWETGMIHPDRILSDLVSIFHPELQSKAGNDLYYYRQLK